MFLNTHIPSNLSTFIIYLFTIQHIVITNFLVDPQFKFLFWFQNILFILLPQLTIW